MFLLLGVYSALVTFVLTLLAPDLLLSCSFETPRKLAARDQQVASLRDVATFSDLIPHVTNERRDHH